MKEQFENFTPVGFPRICENERTHDIQVLIGHCFYGVDQSRQPLPSGYICQALTNDSNPARRNRSSRNRNERSLGCAVKKFFNFAVCRLKPAAGRHADLPFDEWEGEEPAG